MIDGVNSLKALPIDRALPPLAVEIATLLAANASLTAAELQAATGKSQPSISLAIAQLGERLYRLGAARSTRYALTKEILGLSATQQLHYTDEVGRISNFGTLTQLQNRQIVAHANAKATREWISAPGELPWFLKTLRPQGFLGRQYSQLRPDFPSDPDAWSAEQALYIAVNHAIDPPGAFGLGQIMGRLIPQAPVEIGARALHYDQRAQGIHNTLPAGSSAGGEQPKFLTEVSDDAGYHHLIVKFTPPRETPFGKRWRALLHLENLAQTILHAQGVEASQTRIIESPTRTYLESRRFDRIGMEGKRHVVAIDALHSEFVNTSRHNWIQTCAALANKKLVRPAQLGAVARIFAFGQFIGNTDMHFGNLSFFVSDLARDLTRPTLSLAPVYDMLPMMWRPSEHSGELDVTPVRMPPVNAPFEHEQADAREWAIEFWQRASTLEALDEHLKNACAASAQRLREFRRD